MYAALPRSEYSSRVRLPMRYLLPSGWSIPSAYSAAETAWGLPGSSTLPCLLVPCSQTPPESPATLACIGLPTMAFQVFDPVGLRTIFTRLHGFTCVTARASLCLRLTHVVAFMSPRLDSRWGGSYPCRGGNFTRWKRQACPGAPKNFLMSTSRTHPPPILTAAFWTASHACGTDSSRCRPLLRRVPRVGSPASRLL
jgi:hypothetical protein